MTSRLERITQQRLDKLNRIKASGTDPYPNRYHRTHTARQAIEQLHNLESKDTAEDTASVAGRIMAQRKMGKNVFVDLRDGSGKIQLLFQNINQFDQEKTDLFDDLDIGDFIGVSGNLFRTKTGEPTIGVGDFQLLAKSLRPLPEKWHGLQDTELRYRQRYLDLISNPEVRGTFKVRSRVIAGMRQFLNQRGFLEVETPVLQPSAGGALASPFITHHQALDQDFYLRIATEFHLKRLIVGGFDRVYELGRAFRNEGIDTRHNPEFTLLESYEAYADYNDVMKMVEEMTSEVSQQILGTKEVSFDNNTIDLSPPWQRITLRQAVEEYSGIDFVKYPAASGLREKMQSMNIEADPDKNWAKLVDDILKTYVQPRIVQPTFIYDYPVSMSPLAKNKAGEDGVVERFQAYICGLEIGNAYTELNDPVLQRERFEEQLKERQAERERWTIDEDFLLALEYGMPPTGGLGIGIDRLVMLFTDQQSIREVILFPQLKDKP